MFGTTDCSACVEAKNLLDANGLAYVCYKIDNLSRDRKALLKKYFLFNTGASTVPRIYRGHSLIGGRDQLKQRLQGMSPRRIIDCCDPIVVFQAAPKLVRARSARSLHMGQKRRQLCLPSHTRPISRS